MTMEDKNPRIPVTYWSEILIVSAPKSAEMPPSNDKKKRGTAMDMKMSLNNEPALMRRKRILLISLTG